MSGAAPLLPPTCLHGGADSHLYLYMTLHFRAPLDDKTPTERVDGLHRQGSDRELAVLETGMRKWWGCRAVNTFCVLVI